MKPININVLIFLSLISFIISGYHTKEEWKSRSVYQLLTDRFSKDDNSNSACSDLSKYCGGTFNGIKNHLDYIKGMGFDAIWISLPLKNKEGSFHGYHNIDLYNINEHFGSAQELKDLITACHNNDIWVILDAVPNHMAGDLDISTFIPFNKTEHYHIDMPGFI
jgi:alpha-amylase